MAEDGTDKIIETIVADEDQQKAAEDTASLEPAKAQVPAGLEKFVGQDGQIDYSKLHSSYLESEKTLRQTQNDAALLRKTVDSLTVQAPKAAEDKPATDKELETFVTSPRAFIEDSITKLGEPLVRELQVTALKARFPELKESKFADGLKEWMANLPPEVVATANTLEGASFLTSLYKERMGKKPNAAEKKSTVVGPGGPTESPSSGRVFSRAKIRELASSNPAEYARLADEISAAAQEGRLVA